jgi:putative ABC transport system permease protein
VSKRDLSVVLHLFARSARLQKKRATLTIASIAWGTVTILLLLAFGEGLKRQLSSNERAMGENLAIHWPGETSKVWKGLPEGRPIRPRIDDIAALRERLPECEVWGEMRNGRTNMTYGRKTVNGQVSGTSWIYGDPRKHYPQPGGRFLNARDEEEKRRVVFLGYELAEDIFGKEEPVGKTLLVNNSPFTVIGQVSGTSWIYGVPSKHFPLPGGRFLNARDEEV